MLHLALYLCHNPQSVNRVMMIMTMMVIMMMIFTRDDYEIDPTVWLVDWNCQWCDSVSRQKSEKVDLVQNLLCRRSSDKIYSRHGELMKEKKRDIAELILIDLRRRYAGKMLLSRLWYLGTLTLKFVIPSKGQSILFLLFLREFCFERRFSQSVCLWTFSTCRTPHAISFTHLRDQEGVSFLRKKKTETKFWFAVYIFSTVSKTSYKIQWR